MQRYRALTRSDRSLVNADEIPKDCTCCLRYFLVELDSFQKSNFALLERRAPTSFHVNVLTNFARAGLSTSRVRRKSYCCRRTALSGLPYMSCSQTPSPKLIFRYRIGVARAWKDLEAAANDATVSVVAISKITSQTSFGTFSADRAMLQDVGLYNLWLDAGFEGKKPLRQSWRRRHRSLINEKL